MRFAGRSIEHFGHAHFLLEDGYNDETRAVVVLCRPDDPRFVLEKPTPPTTIPGKGAWQAVARWTEDGLRLANAAFAEHTDLIESLVADHLTEMQRMEPVLWAVARDGTLVGSVVETLPMGVAIHCWDDEDAAHAAAAEADEELAASESSEVGPSEGGPSAVSRSEVVPIDDRARFLNAAVRQGYAGALLNGTIPIFFCIDDDGALQHLRLTPGGPSALTMEILDEEDDWSAYDGAEEIAFLDNGEACDERLVATFGRRPPLDWPDDGRLVSIGPRPGTPAIVADDAFESPSAVLFTDAAQAEEYKEDHDPAWVLWEVDDVTAFLGGPHVEGCITHLNPGGHRSRGGILWQTGDQSVLDTFSGFWNISAAGLAPLD